MAAASESPPIYNTSWTLYRGSALYHSAGPASSSTLLHDGNALSGYADRLCDLLKGDAFPTIPGFAESEDLTNAGVLKRCAWTPLSAKQLWSQAQDPGISILSDDNEDDPIGLLLTIAYEKATYKAMFLRSLRSQSTDNAATRGFTSLPLLFIRMPVALRQLFLNFLTTTFDMHVSRLKLQSPTLCSVLENYLTFQSRHDSNAPSVTSAAIRDLILTLSFAQPVAPSLRSMESRLDSHAMLKLLERSRSSGPRSFMPALAKYIHEHTGLEVAGVDDPKGAGGDSLLRVSKIACAAFVLSEEGRLKLVEPRTVLGGVGKGRDEEEGEAVEALRKADVELVEMLIEKASGTVT